MSRGLGDVYKRQSERGSSIVSEPRSDDATEERAPPLDVSVERRRAKRGESAVSEPAPEVCEGSASAAGLSG